MQDDHFSYKNCYQRIKFNLNTMKAILFIYIYIYIYIYMGQLSINVFKTALNF